MPAPTSPVTTPVRFEHHTTALGIGEDAPRLSWVTTSAPTGWSQAGYELHSGDEVVTVDSAESVLVAWPFAPLASGEAREVSVRVRDAAGTWSDWSTPAAVEAGLLVASDWTASWVGPDAEAPSGQLRGTFTLPEGVVRARVYATARGVFELELNGARVGDEELAPGWTTYERRLRYSTFDISDAVRPGPNVLGAWLGDGWWRGHLGWDGRRALYGDDLALLAQVVVDLADGSRLVFGTDADWTWAPGPITASDLYDGEDFDARQHDPAWSTPGFDAAGWKPVQVQESTGAALVAPDGPPVRVTETLGVREVTTSPSGATILDFGQNLVGRLRITLAGPAGTTVTLRHAEVLEGGELATRPLRAARATDTYTLAGTGTEVWAPRFTFHGFRYAEVSGWPGEFDPAAVVAEVMHSDMTPLGRFAASDPRLERLHANISWGMRGNFVSLPTDCPQRDERLGWTGDLQVFAPTANFLYDTGGFLASWLADLAAEQDLLGGTPMVVPARATGYSGPMAGWADAATVVPWSLYEAYGDAGILERQFPSMTAWVDEVAAAAGEYRLWDAGFQFGDWLDPTAPPERPEAAQTYPEIVATAYFARSARIVADAAAVLGRDEDSARYGALADEVRDAFVAEYVTASGRLLSDSATAYALALQFDLLSDPEARARAAGRLADLVRGNGYKIMTGFLGTPVICDALSANGHADVAHRLLFSTENPSWLYAVTMGATTIWERWDSLLPDGSVNPGGMTSFNHYAFGAVGDWLHRVVAGLAPAAPGYRRLRIAPIPPKRGLTSASASLATPYGEAGSAWELTDGQVRLTATVPVGTTAEVVLPSGTVHEVGAGVHTFAEPFEVAADERPHFTLDSLLGDIADDQPALDLLMGVVVKYVPEAAEHMGGGMRGSDGTTVRQVAAMLPHADAVAADLERGLAALNEGRPVPEDVLTPLAPAEPDTDEVAELATLLGGSDMWTTTEGHGVRSLVLVDGPHGVRRQRNGSDHLGLYDSEPATCFPTAAAMASSWDPALVREVGAALGREARTHGVDVLLGPGINIKRSPLGGRNFEYFSEDPLIAGALGAAWVEGLQSTGVGASLKHFAVNSQETDRMRVSSDVDERTLREIYLPAFEHVVRTARPATVMSAYNAINGSYCSENPWLLTDLLRGEWGFEGLVVSDWGAIKDRVAALAAGVDLEMPGPSGEGARLIAEAVASGRLDRSVVGASVARVRALADATAAGSADTADLVAHHALARRVAAESIVLLKNAGALPLAADAQVAVLGELAVDPQFQGGGSSRVNPASVDVPLDELRALVPGVVHAAGYSRAADADAEALLTEAVEVARAAGTAVVFAGLYEAEQSEGFDRTDLDLPEAHVRLIRAVAGASVRTVVVLMNGGVVTLEPWHDEVDAVVEAWSGGQAVGGAIADVLAGRVNPSGRLAETIPLRLEDTPSYLVFPGEEERAPYSEGLFVGYRHHTTVGRAVRHPFGHGLSYTTFETRLVGVDRVEADGATVRVEVTNTGSVAGAEVVQVYVARPAQPVRRPVRELAGFAKVTLEPGATTVVEIELGRRAFASWDVRGQRWKVAPGAYGVELGRSASEIIASAQLELEGDPDRPDPLSLDSTVKAWFAHPVVGPALMAGMLADASPEEQQAAQEGMEMLRMVESMPMGQFARMPMVGIPEETLEQLMALSRA